MLLINPTPPGQLKKYLLGDLGPARRHLQRIVLGTLSPVPGVIAEIEDSINRCVLRIQRDIEDTE